MLNVVVGLVLGFLAGLGVGGGSLLMLWLTLVLDISTETAQGINLLFFLPAAAASLFFQKDQGKPQWKTILPAAAAGIIASVLVWTITKDLDTDTLRKPFGILLIITALRELFYRPRKFK